MVHVQLQDSSMVINAEMFDSDYTQSVCQDSREGKMKLEQQWRFFFYIVCADRTHLVPVNQLVCFLPTCCAEIVLENITC